MVNPTQGEIKDELIRRGNVKLLLYLYQLRMIQHIDQGQKRVVLLAHRRIGKCVAKGTLIATPTGGVPIEHLKPNDYVVGYNNDGTTSNCKVLNLFDQGIKQVYDITNRNKILATSTLEHRWLTQHYWTIRGNLKPRVQSLKDIPKHRQGLSRVIFQIPGGISWVGYKLSNPRLEQCYDIEIDNDTHLFCLMNGLVSHNSFSVLTYCYEFALQQPEQQIRYAAPTQKQLELFIHPIIRNISDHVYENLRPKWNTKVGGYVFPNGSVLTCAGTDGGNAENLRGLSSHLNVVDEAGSCHDLEYIVKSILAPQTLTTGGKTVLVSTAPKDPNHPFVDFVLEAELNNTLAKVSIYDNRANISKQMWDDAVEESGGEHKSHFRREYGLEFVVDAERAIIPEWNDVKDSCIVEHKKDEYYQFYSKYTFMDIGFEHFTYVGFGYYDFLKALFIIEDEWYISGPETTTNNIATNIKQKEQQLWGTDCKPYLRISDNNNKIMLNDLAITYDLHFNAVSKTQETTKDSIVHGMVNKLRIGIQHGKIHVSPTCKMMITTLASGTWNEQRTQFSHNKITGHQDAIAALVYCWKYVDFQSNPIPVSYDINMADHNVYIPHELKVAIKTNDTTGNVAQWDKIFKTGLNKYHKRG